MLLLYYCTVTIGRFQMTRQHCSVIGARKPRFIQLWNIYIYIYVPRDGRTGCIVGRCFRLDSFGSSRNYGVRVCGAATQFSVLFTHTLYLHNNNMGRERRNGVSILFIYIFDFYNPAVSHRKFKRILSVLSDPATGTCFFDKFRDEQL